MGVEEARPDQSLECWLCLSREVFYVDVFDIAWCKAHFDRDYLDDDWDE